ncbi:MAG: thioredoxin domain-containing protein, partial [Candidatus Binatia bacterium]
PEAFETARREGKPLLLSVGYSACHWCHVMEHESFEDEATARLMNEHFVNVKVDREERPDIDEIYMNAVQMMTGQGGWPMTVFLTPEGEPFYGGTYFPPDDRHGMPAFRRVLLAVSEAYRTRPNDVRQTADKIRDGLRAIDRARRSDQPLDVTGVEKAAERLSAGYDSRHGGLGRAPKFPNTMVFSLFLRAFHSTGRRSFLDMTTDTLRKMAEGGIYDQLGGGFHRYSVDERWLVPHFEKMLYDNAQLARLFLATYRASGDEYFCRVAEDILRYVTREMLAPEGGFYATQDADSEGVEGKFFVWQGEEVMRVLGERAGEIFCRVYDVTDIGNFEGRNILHVTLSEEQAARMFREDPAVIRRMLAESRQALFTVRERRPKPFRDEKILSSWNGLMLSAYADALRATGNAEYRQVAERTVRFLREHLWRDGRLLHGIKDGEAKVTGFLDDYAALGLALLDLFEATFAPAHLEWAE